MATPKIAKSARLMQGAVVQDEVSIGENCGIWPNAVLRGDIAPIVIGDGSNIQDGCVLHCDHDAPLTLGENVTVGHMCLLHGCTVGEGTLIGMGSILMNHVKVGKGCLIGAGSLLTEGCEIPDGMMAFGRPAKVVRPLTPEEIQHNVEHARHYADMLKGYNER